MQESDVPQIVDELLAWHTPHQNTSSSIDRPPFCPPFWRGRMGLAKQEQIALHSTTVGSQ